LVQQEVAARAALLEDLLARLPIEAARVRGEVQERLEQLATQARRLAEEVGQLAEAAERGLVAHQLAVLKLHLKLATMPASQQEEEWGRLEGELPASLLAFLPSTEGLGTLGPGQGAPTPPEVEAPPPQQGEQEVVATVAHQVGEGEQQEVQAIIVDGRRLNRGRPPGPKKRDGRGGKREAKAGGAGLRAPAGGAGGAGGAGQHAPPGGAGGAGRHPQGRGGAGHRRPSP